LENERKHNKNPKIEKEEIGYITPAIVSVLTLFISYSFFGNSETIQPSEPVIENKQIPNLTGGNLSLGGHLAKLGKVSERATDGFDSNTYHLVGKNAIKLPQTDVFIDLAKF
jgi:hypothetical protein